MDSSTVLLIIAVVGGFYMAWNIGANDVANAFGTSVGSGALTIRRAVLLAGVFEFSGAFFVGAPVASTVSSHIIKAGVFDAPGLAIVLGAGMVAALLGASLWVTAATVFGQPVSTTHAIIGAVIGFATVAMGPACVQWSRIGMIAASWVVSPLFGGLLAYAIYRWTVQRAILRSRHPVYRAIWILPLTAGALAAIVTFSIVYRGLPRLHLDLSLPWAIGLSLLAGGLTVGSAHLGLALTSVRAVLGAAVLTAGAGFAVTGALLPLLGLALPAGAVLAPPLAGGALAAAAGLFGRFLRIQRRGYLRGERYPVVERLFGAMQIATACYMAFAHGANDVANAIGPLASAVRILRTGHISTTVEVPPWLLAFGGAGIIIGLATYGHKVIEAIGKKITEITPTRGFAAEFGTATSVLVFSKLGMPISTTFVIVGAVMGVGFARGFGAIDLKVIRRIFASWVVTIPVSAVLSAIVFWIMRAATGI